MTPAYYINQVFVGLTVLAIGIAFGYNCGYAINPARDLAPRLFSLMAGWGAAPLLQPGLLWCLVPLLATHLGGVLGAWIYYLAIELHWTQGELVTAGQADKYKVN